MSAPVLYLGSYDAGPGRNAILHEALRSADVDYVEHRVDVWPDTSAKLAAATPLGALRAVARQGRAWRRIATNLPAEAAVVVVGSTAHLDLPVARRVANRLGCPLIFDPLISASETLRDRGITRWPTGQRLLTAVEGRLFRLADVVLADTAVHAGAWGEELGVPAERCRVVPAGALGAFSEVPDYEPREGRMRVTYFGQYIPLHGIPVVLAAAAALREDPIDFLMVGRGQTLEPALRMAAQMQLTNVYFDQGWRSPADLARDVISQADVCLGAFSPEPKAMRVVPFKVYAAMAAGRPVVTGDTPAVRELLRAPGEVEVVLPGDPLALANSLRSLAARPLERRRLAQAARTAYLSRFSAPVLGGRLASVFAEAVVARRVGPSVAIPARAPLT